MPGAPIKSTLDRRGAGAYAPGRAACSHGEAPVVWRWSRVLCGAGGALLLAAASGTGPCGAAPADSLSGARPAPPRTAHAADLEAAHSLDVAAGSAHSRFADIEAWLRVWDDPQPAASGEPERVVALLHLQPSMRLALLGAATGYFNARLARAVGREGTAYVVDEDPELVRQMGARAAREATPNVVPVLETGGEPQLPVPHVDRVLLVDTYHHLRDRRAYCERLQHRLTPNGLLVVVEWQPGELARGPSAAWKISPEKVTEELRSAGYRLVERVELRYHYGLVFRAPPSGPR